MKNKLYLAYGSNLNLKQMADRCPTAKVVGASQINDHRLLFRGAHAGAVATIEPFEGGNVPVLVWEITPTDEAALDRYEGWPFLYRKGSRVSIYSSAFTSGRSQYLIFEPSLKRNTPSEFPTCSIYLFTMTSQYFSSSSML
jgi:hypothetical protein